MAAKSKPIIDARTYGLDISLRELASALENQDVVGILVSKPQSAAIVFVWAISRGYSVIGALDTGKGILLVVASKQVRGMEAYNLLGELLRQVYQVKPPENIVCLEEASASLLDPVTRARLILRGEHVATVTGEGLEGLLSLLPKDEHCYLLRIDAGADTVYLIACGGRALGCTINESYAEPDMVAERIERAGRVRIHVYRLPEEFRPPATEQEQERLE